MDAAVATAIDYAKAKEAGRVGFGLKTKHALFDRLVYSRLREHQRLLVTLDRSGSLVDPGVVGTQLHEGRPLQLGVFLRRNIITILMCVELMLNAANLALVAFSRSLGAYDGQVLVFFVMTVAAAEAAVGLAIIIALHRHKDTLDVDAFNLMKW